MTATKVLITAAALLLAIPVVPALAHDDDDNGYSRHEEFHDQLSDAHERAHEQGFWSRAEHRAYHRALRDMHHNYHDDNGYGSAYRGYYAPRRSYYVPYSSSYYGGPRFSAFSAW